MKRVLIMSIMLAGCVTASVSCSEETEYDVYGSKEKKVFINEGLRDGYRNNLGSYTVTHTVAGSYADKSLQVAFPVRLSGTADEEVKVTLSVGDATLTARLNEKYGTSYASADIDWQFGVLDSVKVDGSYAIDTERATLTIPAGASQSKDSIALYIPEEACTGLHEEAYLIPITIESVGNEGVSVTGSEDLTYSFITIGTKEDSNLLKQVSSAEISGAQLADRSGMSATLESEGSFSGSSSNLFDGNSRTSWYSWSQLSAKFIWDLGAEYKDITGMALYGRYCYPKEVNIQYSSDGTTWSDLADFDSASYSTYNQYYAAYTPFPARYISINIESWGGYYAGFSEFYLYTKE